jgi:hypothetical protein
MFKRQLYIADLFRPEQIINGFEYAEFNSVKALELALKMNYFRKEGTMRITIRSYDEFDFLLKSDFKGMEIFIVVPTKDLLDEIMNVEIPEDFDVTIISMVPYKTSDYWKVNSGWISKHVIGMVKKIAAYNIGNDVCELIEFYNMNNVRFFELDIDYISFSELKIKELDEAEYWFNHLRDWAKENKDFNPIVIMSRNRFYRKIFVDDNLDLYLNSRKGEWRFSLLDYSENDGNNIPKHVLNKLHKYLDLTAKALYSKFMIYNWNLIDYDQILKMGYYINEIPIIVGLVQRWLYGQ